MSKYYCTKSSLIAKTRRSRRLFALGTVLLFAGGVLAAVVSNYLITTHDVVDPTGVIQLETVRDVPSGVSFLPGFETAVVVGMTSYYDYSIELQDGSEPVMVRMNHRFSSPEGLTTTMMAASFAESVSCDPLVGVDETAYTEQLTATDGGNSDVVFTRDVVVPSTGLKCVGIAYDLVEGEGGEASSTLTLEVWAEWDDTMPSFVYDGLYAWSTSTDVLSQCVGGNRDLKTDPSPSGDVTITNGALACWYSPALAEDSVVQDGEWVVHFKWTLHSSGTSQTLRAALHLVNPDGSLTFVGQVDIGSGGNFDCRYGTVSVPMDQTSLQQGSRFRLSSDLLGNTLDYKVNLGPSGGGTCDGQPDTGIDLPGVWA